MNKISPLIFFYSLLVLMAQILVPKINYYSLDVIIDLMIIYLTYIGFYYGRLYSILFGFAFGIIQDMLTQVDLLGVIALSKSIVGFGLGALALYFNVWSVSVRLLFIFLMYSLHFSIFYFFKFNGMELSIWLYFQIILIHSILCLFVLIVLDKSFLSNGIISKSKDI